MIRDLYDARARKDLEAIRALLAEDVVWREAERNKYTGSLNGVDAVLAMMEKAAELTNGTFELQVSEVLANSHHAVALIRWTATVNGQTIESSEFAMFRIESGKIKDVWFFEEHPNMDEVFWADA